jgi:hypothetical protein
MSLAGAAWAGSEPLVAAPVSDLPATHVGRCTSTPLVWQAVPMNESPSSCE